MFFLRLGIGINRKLVVYWHPKEDFFILDSADNEKSAAQKRYEKDRFRVQPGRIEEYSLGRGSIARQEAEKVTFICHYNNYTYLLYLLRYLKSSKYI